MTNNEIYIVGYSTHVLHTYILGLVNVNELQQVNFQNNIIFLLIN